MCFNRVTGREIITNYKLQIIQLQIRLLATDCLVVPPPKDGALLIMRGEHKQQLQRFGVELLLEKPVSTPHLGLYGIDCNL